MTGTNLWLPRGERKGDGQHGGRRVGRADFRLWNEYVTGMEGTAERM